MEDLKITDKPTINLKGDVIVTDPCYFFPDKVWDRLCKLKFSDKGKKKKLYNVCTVNYNGVSILISGTTNGDGVYYVEETGTSFGVDSGCMAVVEKNKLMKLEIRKDFDIEMLAVIVKNVNGEVKTDGKGNFTGVINIQTDDET
jgi:hypothetical protein